MKEIFTALVFFLLILAMLSRTVPRYPGEPLSNTIAAELQCLTHPH